MDFERFLTRRRYEICADMSGRARFAGNKSEKVAASFHHRLGTTITPRKTVFVSGIVPITLRFRRREMCFVNY